jgi:hypothetical protein
MFTLLLEPNLLPRELGDVGDAVFEEVRRYLRHAETEIGG